MLLTLESLGIDVECQHHEVATAGQAEIDMRFKPLLQMGDQLMWFKYVLKNVANRRAHRDLHAQTPLRRQRHRHAHPHQHLERRQAPVRRRQIRRRLPGGPVGHGRHLEALQGPVRLHQPHHQLYKRLVPGFEAPVNLAYSSRNRSAAIRIPMYSASPKAKRIEFRTPDPSCNGYLAFSAM
jgi:glutamine synthetase